MSGHAFITALGIILLAGSVLCAGCLSPSVGDVGYSNQSILINISHTGEPTEAHVQVTVYRLANLTQEELTVLGAPVSLFAEKNSLSIPVTLEPGSYKLYVYVIIDGNRKTAVIRDITV